MQVVKNSILSSGMFWTSTVKLSDNIALMSYIDNVNSKPYCRIVDTRTGLVVNEPVLLEDVVFTESALIPIAIGCSDNNQFSSILGNKVLITYPTDSGKLRGVLVTVDEFYNINVGTPVDLANLGSIARLYVSLTSVSSNKLLLVIAYDNLGNPVAKFVNYELDVLVVGDSFNLAVDRPVGVFAVKIDETRSLLLWRENSFGRGLCRLINTSGSVPAWVGDTLNLIDSGYVAAIKGILYSSGKVFTLFQYNNNVISYVLLDIAGDVVGISKPCTSVFSDSLSVYRNSLCYLQENQIGIYCFADYTTIGYGNGLNFQVLDISGTNVNLNGVRKLIDNYTFLDFNIVKINSGRLLVIGRDNTNNLGNVILTPIYNCSAPVINVSGYKQSSAVFVPFNTTISSVDGSTVYYTLDNTQPVSGLSGVYSNGVGITNPTTLKAIATKYDTFDSDVSVAVYTLDLLVHFKFNGDYLDSSGNGVVISQDVNVPFASDNKSIYFDGTTAHQMRFNNPIQNTTNWSISFWSKSVYVNSYQSMLSNYKSGTNGFDLVYKDGYYSELYDKDTTLNGSGYYMSSPHNEWIHWVVTYTPGVVKIYNNKMLVSYRTVSTGFSSFNNALFYIGCRYEDYPARKFKGNIACLRIYNRTLIDGGLSIKYNLDSNEISEIFENEKSNFNIDPVYDYVAKYKFDGNLYNSVGSEYLIGSGGGNSFEYGNKWKSLGTSAYQMSLQNSVVSSGKDLSICFWFKPYYSSGTGYIISNYSGTGYGFNLSMVSDNTVEVREGDNLLGTFSIVNGRNQFFCLRFNNTTKVLSIYVNNLNVLNVTLTVSPYIYTYLYLCCKLVSSGYIVGTMDDLRIYHRIISDAEMNLIYNHICSVFGIGFYDTALNGVGTEIDPFQINYPIKLANMGAAPYNAVGKYFAITHDIDTTDLNSPGGGYSNWVPIAGFLGYLDGNNHTVKYVMSGSATVMSLFNSVGNSSSVQKFRRLNLDIDLNGTSANAYMTGLFYNLTSNGASLSVEYVNVKGTIRNSASAYMAGLCIPIQAVTLSYCKTSIDYYSFSNYVCGILFGNGNAAHSIKRCAAFGNIYSSSGATTFNNKAGIAYLSQSSVSSTVEECINGLKIVTSLDSSSLAGIVLGSIHLSTIKNNVNLADIGSDSVNYNCINVTGIVYASSNGSYPNIQNNLNRGKISGSSNVAGIRYNSNSINSASTYGNVNVGNVKRTKGTTASFAAIGINLYHDGVSYRNSYFENESGVSSQTFPTNANSENGTIKTDAQLKMQSTYQNDLGWDFTTPIWAIVEGYDYPVLAWNMLSTPTISTEGGD